MNSDESKVSTEEKKSSESEPEPKPRGRPKGSLDSKPRKQSKPKKSTDGTPLLPGDNARYIAHLWEVGSISKQQVDFNDDKLVEYVIGKYFQICVKDDMKPTLAALAVAFHTNRKTLLRWLSGEAYKNATKSRELLMTAYAILNAQMEIYMNNGKINPVAAIFLMKNNFGYEDKSEQVITPKVQEISTQEDLQKKYLAVAEAAGIEAPKPTVEESVKKAETEEA